MSPRRIAVGRVDSFTFTLVLVPCEIIQDNIHQHPPSTEEGNGPPKQGEFLSPPHRTFPGSMTTGRVRPGQSWDSQWESRVLFCGGGGAFVYQQALPTWHTVIHLNLGKLSSWEGLMTHQ